MKRIFFTTIIATLIAATSIGQTTGQSALAKSKGNTKPSANKIVKSIAKPVVKSKVGSMKKMPKQASSPALKPNQAPDISTSIAKALSVPHQPSTAAQTAPTTPAPALPFTPPTHTATTNSTPAQSTSTPSTTTQSPPTTPTTTSAAQTPTTTTTSTEAPQPKKISNVFTDADLKTIIQEIATSSKTSIIADTSVKGTEINIEFKKDTVESALDKLSYAAGLLWKKKGDIYLVSTGQPDAPMFGEFAETKVYTPRTQPAENLFGLLTRSFTTYAQLDKAANMISITAPPKQMDAILKALAAADSPRKQFCVEALVTEMNDQTIKNAGFSWNWQYFAQGADLGFTYATASASDIVNIKALITTNKAELRANPKIVASEGHEASLTVGTETYFSMVSGNASYSTVQYQKINTGITLKFTGFIEPDGMVNLHLQPEVSDAVVLVNGNPQTTVRKADTYLRIRFGETVALGGLIVGTTNNQVNKTPILGDLPVVGNLFRSTSKEKTKREVVILITPRMIEEALRSGDISGSAKG